MPGFSVHETIPHPPAAVWAYLTDFGNAKDWMNGVDGLAQVDGQTGPPALGTVYRFTARGKERRTQVSALDPGRQIALTSTQGPVSATYTYTLAAAGDGTELRLDAVCTASGPWKLLHPLIAFAMKKSDGSQLAHLKAAMARAG